MPNLRHVTLLSDILQRKYKFRITARALHTVEAKGGLDGFLLTTKKEQLSASALAVRELLMEKIGGKQ